MFVQALWVNNAVLVGLGYLSFISFCVWQMAARGIFLTLNESVGKCFSFVAS